MLFPESVKNNTCTHFYNKNSRYERGRLKKRNSYPKPVVLNSKNISEAIEKRNELSSYFERVPNSSVFKYRTREMDYDERMRWGLMKNRLSCIYLFLCFFLLISYNKFRICLVSYRRFGIGQFRTKIGRCSCHINVYVSIIVRQTSGVFVARVWLPTE